MIEVVLERDCESMSEEDLRAYLAELNGLGDQLLERNAALRLEGEELIQALRDSATVEKVGGSLALAGSLALS